MEPEVFLVTALAILWAITTGRIEGILTLLIDIFEGKIKSHEKNGATDKGQAGTPPPGGPAKDGGYPYE
jgi:hypothetical protein